MSRVHFKKGNLEEFNSIIKDPNTIYFVDGGNSGTGHQIYLGDIPYYTVANFFTNSGKDGDMPVHYKKSDVWFVKDSIPELDENGEQITANDGNIVMKEVAFIKFCINDYIDQYKDNDWQQLSLNGTSATIQELDWNPSSTYYKTGISNNAVITGKPGKTSEVIYNGNQDTILGFKEIFNDIINNKATGNYSHAEGTHTDATGVAAHAEGEGAIASGDNSHAEGEHTNSSGNDSHSEGNHTKAIGLSSHSEGNNTAAIGDYSHAEGRSANIVPETITQDSTDEEIIEAWNNSETVDGYFSLAKGECSHTEGKDCLAIGNNSHAEGIFTKAIGNASHSQGQETEAIGDRSFASGQETKAVGEESSAFGFGTTASGAVSHAEGQNTEASGESSHSEGEGTQANMDASHAEGYQTLASERYAHAEGEKTKVLGEAAHAEGKNTKASGLYSHAEGYNTYAGSENFNETDINKTEPEYLDTGGYCEFNFFASGNYDTPARRVAIVNPESEHYYWGYTSDSPLFTYAIKDPVNEDNYIEFSFNELSISASPIFGVTGNACAYIYQIDVDGSPVTPPSASPLPKELSYAYKYYRQEYEATNPTKNQIKQVPIYIKNFKKLKTKIVDIPESTPIGNISKLEGYHNFRLSSGGEIKIKNGFEITFGKSNMKINKNLELYKIGDGYFRCVGDRDGSIARTLWMEPFLNGKIDYTNYTPKEGDRIQLVEIDTSISASEIFGTSNPVGISAHAEGQNTKASGISAHAEGIGNLEITYHPIDNINKNFLGRIISLNKICLNTEINRKFPTDILFKLNDINFYFLTGEQEGETTSGSGYYLYNIKTVSGVPADLSNEYELKIVMDENKAQGIGSHCEGIGTKALTAGSHSSGCYTTTTDDYQTVIGAANSTTGNGPFIVGIGTAMRTANEGIKQNGFRIDWEGNVYAAKTVNSNAGADYAEYFEWKDQNLKNEDRRGLFVKLDGEKIVKANRTDEDILGIISTTQAIIGDTRSEAWKGTYETDIFGEIIKEKAVDKITGKEILIPKVNPDYNPSEIYVPRSERPEWSPVGMVGKLVAIDDGTCEVNGYCGPGDNGVATRSLTPTNCRVMARIDENHIKVLLK